MPANNVIAPGITLESYAAGEVDPLLVFENRIQEWLFPFARDLAQREDSGLCILLLTAAVIEPLGAVLPGAPNTSKGRFCFGFARIFKNLLGERCLEISERAHDLLRSGLFHEGFIKAGLVITKQDEAIQELDGG